MNNQGYREIFKFDAANLKILNDTLRALWKKIMGRVEMKDLSDAARKVIDSKASAGDVESTVSQSAQEIMTSVENTANGLRSEFNQTAKEIRTEVSDSVSSLGTAVEQNAEEIALVAGRTVGGTNYLLDSGVEIATSAYHMANYFFSDALKPKAGETVTIRIWGTLGTGRTEFAVYNTNAYIEIGMLTDNGDGTHSGTFTWRTENSNYPSYSQTDESQTHVRIYARPNNSAITSISTIEKIKLEIGNTATDWSAHPEELNAGSSVRINEKGVYISGGEIEMQTTSGDEYLHITGSGIDASSLSAPNVTPRYDGPATLYVNPNATSAQIAAGNYYRSLADAAAAINYKWIDKGITINLAAGMVEYGTVTFRGTCGGQWITIKGDSTNHAKLVGKLLIYLCMSHVSVQYLDIDSPVNQRAIDVSGGYADISNCVITGKGTAATVNGATNSASIGILAEQGARVVTGSCEIYDVYRSLYTQTAGQLQSSNNKGNCTVGANRTHMFVSGTAPCASTSWTYSEVAGGKVWTSSDITVNQGSKPTAEAEPTTVNYNFTYADSYAGGWSYFEDADVRQGYVGGKRIYGTIWFNASTIKTALTGKTIKQASLRLYMQSGVGRGVSVSVQMYGTNMAYDGRSGAPALTTSYGTIGSTAPGQLNEITIPTQVITDIVNGTIQALVLYSDDTDYYSGRNYSKNYARFDGSTSGDSSTRPRLTVVYS